VYVLFLIFTYFISIIILNYTSDQLLVLRPYGGNTIYLSMRPRSGKHPNQIGLQNVSIGIINCQSICNKSDETSDVVKDMNLDVLIITET